jgi:protein OS-9
MAFACVCASLPRSAIADLVDDLMTFADESNEAYVVHLGSDSKAAPLTADEREMLRDDNRAVMMTAHDGKRYFCELPLPSRDDSGEAANEEDDARAAFTAEERSALIEKKLDTAHEQGCFYRVEGWWTYEFCYKKQVRQYHQEGTGAADPAAGEFSLGAFDADATAAANARDPSRLQTLESALAETPRAHTHVFTGGTPCDLTSLERETEVVFKCAPGPGAAPAVAAIAEPATCRYSLTFATPVLCEGNESSAKKKDLSHVKCRVVEEALPEEL